jgi:hypothetical protein
VNLESISDQGSVDFRSLQVAHRPRSATAFDIASPIAIDTENRLVISLGSQQLPDGEWIVVRSLQATSAGTVVAFTSGGNSASISFAMIAILCVVPFVKHILL